MPQETYQVNLSDSPVERNLLVFMDGTWNDENGRNNDGAVTNIYKLFSALAGTDQSDHIPFTRSNNKNLGLYFRGVGNDEDNIKVMGYYQGAFGAGEKNIRDHAYASVCKHYRPGDRICILGYSRGASSARLLASKLEKHGLPKEITLKYRSAKNKQTGQTNQLFTGYKAKDEGSANVDVEFLGLFDTVGAFGIPINLGPLNFQKINLFKDLSLAKNIKRAVHCLALDESREPFIPTLTNLSHHIDEVWFPGVHGDVGGGNHDGALGNITMDYMVSSLNAAVSDIQYRAATLQKHTAYNLTNDEFILHYHGDGFFKHGRELEVLVKEKPSSVQKPRVHESVRTLMQGDNMFYTERYNSFATKVPIKYDPLNLRDVPQGIEFVS